MREQVMFSSNKLHFVVLKNDSVFLFKVFEVLLFKLLSEDVSFR